MELRDLANSEASAFIDRLVAAAEARAEKARAEADQQVNEVRGELETLRGELESETARATALEADLDAVIEAHRQVDADRLTAESARAQEAGARARLEDELRGVRELLNRARAEVTRVSESLEDEGAQKALLEEELNGLRQAISALEKTHATAEKKTAKLEGRLAELEQTERSLRSQLADATSKAETVQKENAAAALAMRERFDVAIRTARAEAESLSADRDAARADIEMIRHEVEAVRKETAALRAHADAVQAERDALRVETENLKTEKEALRRETQALKTDAAGLRSQADALRAETGTIRKDLEGARAEAGALKAEAATLRKEASALKASGSSSSNEIASLQEMLDASREHHERQVATVKQLEARLHDAESRLLSVDSTSTATLSTAIRAIDALGGAANMSELFVVMVSQLSTELPRVALFRVKGNHLEGDHAAGLDESTQIKKIVIPMTMDSVIARAATSGTLVRADGDELVNGRPPLSGSPVSAFAVPITFQGETLAVLYADSEKPTTTAHCALALLIVRHSMVLLARLTNELKALKELRDYATMLIQEAEQMFIADVDGGRPAQESIRRLRDTVDCGRQLFAQRAELEGSAAAGVFDEQVAIVISARASAFAEALEAATQNHKRAAS